MSTIHLPDDPFQELAAVAGTQRRDRYRAVREDGEVVGYWQTPEWLDGLNEIAAECERIVLEESKALAFQEMMDGEQ